MSSSDHSQRPEFEYRPFRNDEGRNSRQANIELPLFVRVLGIPDGARILEVGCGRGIALRGITELCWPRRLVGLDIDAALLAQAALTTDGLNAELVCADVRRMPFPDESFDVVIDFGTCYHIGHPAQAMKEINRVLVPGGIFCHETPLMQVFSHPVRWGGRTLPWNHVPELAGGRRALMWSSRRRRPGWVGSSSPRTRAKRPVRTSRANPCQR